MQNRFYERALKAATESPEAFAAELKKEDVDVNVKKYGDYGDSLIHAVIEDISDEKLSDLLKMLIQHDANLESEDMFGRTPLTLAVLYHKKNAIECLINNNANVNACSLNAAIHENEQENLNIMNILVKHGADVNFKGQCTRSPLMSAVSMKSLPMTSFLLSNGADLFLKATYGCGSQYETAVGVAYQEYVSAQRLKDVESIQGAKKCLDLLVEAISDYLYREGSKQFDETLFMTNAIKDLSGRFYGMTNSTAVSGFLEENIKPAALIARIRAEKRHVFCMGSAQRSVQNETKMFPTPVQKFFQNDGRRDLTREIFSYMESPAKKQRIR